MLNFAPDFVYEVNADLADESTEGGVAAAGGVYPIELEIEENTDGLLIDFDGNNGDGGRLLDAETAETEVVYTLSGPDADLFSIDAFGQLTFNAPPDFENPIDGVDGEEEVIQPSDADGVGNNEYNITVEISEIIFDDDIGPSVSTDAPKTGLTTTQDVIIEVLDDDSTPTADDNGAATTLNTSVSINVLFNDDFGDDGPGALILGGSTDQGGTLAIDDGGTPDDVTDDRIIYTPADGFEGFDTFEYRIEDANDDDDDPGATATVTVNVGPEAVPGVAEDDSASVFENATVAIDVLANDDDVDEGSLSLASADTTGLQGTLSFTDGVFTYDPDGAFDDLNAGEQREVAFTYTVGDGVGGVTEPATVTITVNGVDAPPVVEEIDGDPWDEPVLIGNLDGDEGLGTAFDGGDGLAFDVDVAGSAQVTGSGQSDSITGGAFSDRINGGAGDDTINGGAGVDRIAGNAGDDVVDGGAGDDFVYGNAGDDQVFGGAGNDRVDGGAGDDLLTGGEGEDVFVYDGRGNDVITDFEIGIDTLELPVGETFTAATDLDAGGTVLTFSGGGTLTISGFPVEAFGFDMM